MPHTKWKQDFFDDVKPISLKDPLASILGATDDGEPIHYTYKDCVKLAGHSCASVSSAYRITQLALEKLYNGELPVRGEIEVRYAGHREAGANGPIGQVIQFITGASIETGFHGLGGEYARDNKFVYDENMENDSGGITVVFKRTDTGKKVIGSANPSQVRMSEEEIEFSTYMPKVLQGIASNDERDMFYKYWQGKNRKILLEDHPEAFTVEEIGA
jgi:formylmethanofuran dehydrogenase subunit E